MDPAHLTMIAIAAVAAVIDHRTGLIPNWLTLPVLAIAPLFGLVVSPHHALAALVGIGLCGLCPYLMFRMRALGGGDVKLLAALGGLGGATLGLETQLYSFVVAMVI